MQVDVIGYTTHPEWKTPRINQTENATATTVVTRRDQRKEQGESQRVMTVVKRIGRADSFTRTARHAKIGSKLALVFALSFPSNNSTAQDDQYRIRAQTSASG